VSRLAFGRQGSVEDVFGKPGQSLAAWVNVDDPAQFRAHLNHLPGQLENYRGLVLRLSPADNLRVLNRLWPAQMGQK
jgi:hypothetical protein